MRCKTAAKHLDRFRTGEIPPKLGSSLGSHLRDCPACAEELQGIRRLAARIPSLAAMAPHNLVQVILRQTMDKFGSIETLLGKVWIAFNTRGITMVRPGKDNADRFLSVYLSRRFRTAIPAAVPEGYADMVRKAASGSILNRPRLDLEGLTPFEQKVLLLLPQIPRGEVRPYSWLAREVGNPKAARAIGTAMARNPVPLLLPCHRVVPSTGGIGNYAFGSAMKRALLEHEGVPVGELDSMAQAGVRYLGCKTTGIFCFPTCRDARRMNPENRVQFSASDQAVQSGYRPCRHCRP